MKCAKTCQKDRYRYLHKTRPASWPRPPRSCGARRGLGVARLCGSVSPTAAMPALWQVRRSRSCRRLRLSAFLLARRGLLLRRPHAAAGGWKQQHMQCVGGGRPAGGRGIAGRLPPSRPVSGACPPARPVPGACPPARPVPGACPPAGPFQVLVLRPGPFQVLVLRPGSFQVLVTGRGPARTRCLSSGLVRTRCLSSGPARTRCLSSGWPVPGACTQARPVPGLVLRPGPFQVLVLRSGSYQVLVLRPGLRGEAVPRICPALVSRSGVPRAGTRRCRAAARYAHSHARLKHAATQVMP